MCFSLSNSIISKLMLFNVFYVYLCMFYRLLKECERQSKRMNHEIVWLCLDCQAKCRCCWCNLTVQCFYINIIHSSLHVASVWVKKRRAVKLPPLHIVYVLCVCTFRLKEFERDYYHVKIHRRFSSMLSLKQLFSIISFRFMSFCQHQHIFMRFAIYFSLSIFCTCENDIFLFYSLCASLGFYTVLHNLIYYSKRNKFLIAILSTNLTVFLFSLKIHFAENWLTAKKWYGSKWRRRARFF